MRTIMETYLEDPEICELVCRTLTKLVAFVNQEGKRRDAAELITEALKAHIENADVCKYGCRALYYITYNNSKMEQSFSHTLCLILA